jgi:hypothetical protein
LGGYCTFASLITQQQRHVSAAVLRHLLPPQHTSCPVDATPARTAAVCRLPDISACGVMSTQEGCRSTQENSDLSSFVVHRDQLACSWGFCPHTTTRLLGTCQVLVEPAAYSSAATAWVEATVMCIACRSMVLRLSTAVFVCPALQPHPQATQSRM